MADPPNNPSVCLIRMVFSRDTRTYNNVFHVKLPSGSWDLTKMQDAINVFVDWWNTAYKLACWTGVGLTEVQARVLDPSFPLALDFNVTPVIFGTLSGTVSSGQDTVAVSERTGLAGRKERGRFYAVGLTDSYKQSNDALTSTAVSTYGSIAAGLLSRLVSAALTLVVFHRADNTVSAVVSTLVENLVDSQRRRLAARGT